ncbi:MAG: DNA (cytosine-5-)-methyltransferase [Bacteroidales bacterium]|nr:DNA (cytosine-5-)-methyltransferase [Bacteroidales bacterium]
MNQTSIFEYLYEDYKIKKPIRIIELFAGYGSQLFALKYLGANVTSHKIVEWAVPSIQAYKDAHFHDRNDDHTSNKTFDDLVDELLNYGISSDYNEPMTRQQIVRKGLNWCKQVYNNIKNTDNLVNIMNTKGVDLEVEEQDKYDYIMTYSFPCQDLSIAGKLGGMDEDSETRSSMLWQVKRILDELNQTNSLPQVLLMENVIQVIGKGNIQNMEKWDMFLSRLGYKSYIKNMIATDYGIPQIRNRTFMISILGEYNYTFPNPIPLKLKLKDMLEKNVDERYYLSGDILKHIKDTSKETVNFTQYDRYNGQFESLCLIWKELSPTIHTKSYEIKIYDNNKIRKLTPSDNFIIMPEKTKKGYAIAEDGDGIYINRPHQKRGVVQKGKIQTIKTKCDDIAVVVNTNNKRLIELIEKTQFNENDTLFLDAYNQIINNKMAGTITTRVDASNATFIYNKLRIRKLTPKECFRLMGVKDEDYQRIAANQSNSSLYHLAGDSIVVNVLMYIFKQLL